MGREVDRPNGACKTLDAERNPGHYINMSEDGAVMGVLQRDRIPDTRDD